MYLRPLSASLLVFLLLSSGVKASFLGIHGMQGNDTGGIIPWSPELEYHRLFKKIAKAHCAGYNKIAFITGAVRGYGEYVSFVCYFPNGFDPRKGFFPPPTTPALLRFWPSHWWW